MVDATIELTREDLRGYLRREAERLRQRWLAEHKRALIQTSATEDETVAVAGHSTDEQSTAATDAVRDYDEIPDDAHVVEVHVEVDQPTTVRYVDPADLNDPDAPDTAE